MAIRQAPIVWKTDLICETNCISKYNGMAGTLDDKTMEEPGKTAARVYGGKNTSALPDGRSFQAICFCLAVSWDLWKVLNLHMTRRRPFCIVNGRFERVERDETFTGGGLMAESYGGEEIGW